MERKRKNTLPLVAGVLFFVICFATSAYLAYRTSAYIFDSDASSELILAELLAKEGGILSENWCYSTELRVLNTQLIFAPLFRVFTNWRTVRYVGALILQLILVASFFFCARQMGIRVSICFVGMGLLLLPLSVSYARMMLMHCYYVPHVAIAFCLLGCFLAAVGGQRRSHKSLKYTVCFLLLSFVSGLGGVRQLMVSFLPLLLIVSGLLVLRAVREQREMTQSYQKTDWRTLIISLEKAQESRGFLMTLCASTMNLMGYAVNAGLLSRRYMFDSFNEQLFYLSDGLPYEMVWGCVLRLFGYRDMTKVLSPAGIVICASLALLACCFGVSVWFLYHAMRDRQENKDGRAAEDALTYGQIVSGLAFPIGMATTALILLFTNVTDINYLIPAMIFFIPMICLFVENAEHRGQILQRPVMVAVVAVCALNAILVDEYFIVKHCSETVNPHSSIQYEGLPEGTIDQVRALRLITDELQQQGYRYGYASFWNGNICTEMTNGDLRITPVEIDKDRISERAWLSDLRIGEQCAGQKSFLLLTWAEYELIEALLDREGYDKEKLLIETEEYVVYEIEENGRSPIEREEKQEDS